MRLPNLALLILLFVAFIPALAVAAETTLPSYQADLERYHAEQSKAKDGPKISTTDRAVMKQATQDLAERMPAPGLKVGEAAPDFELTNALGKPVRLSVMLQQGPIVLTFYRGAWCPYCNLQLRGLKQVLPHIERQGAHLVAVTPQTPDKSLEQVKKDGYPFEILSDLDSEVMKAYRHYFEVPASLSDVYIRNFGLDLAEFNGKDRYVLPVPGTYVIDTTGVVRAAFADVDYTKRMEPADIVAALARISHQADPVN